MLEQLNSNVCCEQFNKNIGRSYYIYFRKYQTVLLCIYFRKYQLVILCILNFLIQKYQSVILCILLFRKYRVIISCITTKTSGSHLMYIFPEVSDGSLKYMKVSNGHLMYTKFSYKHRAFLLCVYYIFLSRSIRRSSYVYISGSIRQSYYIYFCKYRTVILYIIVLKVSGDHIIYISESILSCIIFFLITKHWAVLLCIYFRKYRAVILCILLFRKYWGDHRIITKTSGISLINISRSSYVYYCSGSIKRLSYVYYCSESIG